MATDGCGAAAGTGAAPLVDGHVHLQDPYFDGRLERVVAEARGAGVRWLVCNGSRPSDWGTVADLAARHPGVVLPSFGLHPWYAAEGGAGWEEDLAGYLDRFPSAVGEIGLDRVHGPGDRLLQEEVFRRQLRLAAARRLPATIHCVRSFGRLREMLDEGPRPPRFLLHAYGGPLELVGPLAERGAWFSFGGSVLLPSRERSRRALRGVPPDRLLLETDAPDPAPPGGRAGAAPRHPDPADLPILCREVAALLGQREDSFRERLLANARTLFGGLVR
jgi:TatD DNase family protein